MRLKGIKSQIKLAKYLKTHEEDSLNLGFFKNEDNELQTPNQRTFSYFIKNHLDKEKKQIIEFAVSKIERIADKFNIVLDIEVFEKKEAVKKDKSKKNPDKEYIKHLKLLIKLLENSKEEKV